MAPLIERITVGALTVDMALPDPTTQPPVVLVHGYFVDASPWERMISVLVERGFPCYAVNLRGRAGSRPGTDVGRASLADYAEDVIEVARALTGPDRVGPIVIGHSMGGLVAQMVIERGVARAGVLLAPAPPKGISILSARLAIAQVGYMPAILRSKPVAPGRKDLRALALNKVPEVEREELLDRMVPDSGQAGREMSITGIEVNARRVRVPMLVIAGDEDRFIPLRIVRKVAKRYDAELRVAPGRGHMLILEPGWEEIAAWTADWIEQHVDPATTAERAITSRHGIRR